MIHSVLGFPPRPRIPAGKPSAEMQPHYLEAVDWLDATDAHLEKLELLSRRAFQGGVAAGASGVALAASGTAGTTGLVLAGLGLAAVGASLALRALTRRERDYSGQRRTGLQAVLQISGTCVRQEVERFLLVGRSQSVDERGSVLRLPGVALRKRA